MFNKTKPGLEKLFLTAVLIFCGMEAFAQNTITGKVSDLDGQPLPGVAVYLKGTTTGVMTDDKGNYSLNNRTGSKTVVFSYLGYKSYLTKTSGDNGIDVVVKSRKYSVGIQTKLYYNHNVSNKAIQEVFAGKNYYKTDYAMAITNWKFSNPAKDLARELKVIVIDRNMLTKMIKSSRKDNKRLIKTLVEECV